MDESTERQTRKPRKTLRACIITALISVLVTLGFCSYFLVQRTPFLKVYEVVQVLDQTYYKDFDKSEILEGAPRGVVSALGDPYTAYMTEKEWIEFSISTTGEYSGIGITLSLIHIFTLFQANLVLGPLPPKAHALISQSCVSLRWEGVQG